MLFRRLPVQCLSTFRGMSARSARVSSQSSSHRALMSGMPTVIRPSREETEAGALNERNLEKAARSVHQDGLVVVEGVVPHGDIDALNEKMIEDALVLQARGTDGPYNYNLGNLQQDPPPVAEFFYPSIFTSNIATQITSSVLGPRPKWTFCSANSAMPAQKVGDELQRQPVHSDADFDHPAHPFALVVNVPLVTMTPDNGSTEIWLGTHSPAVSGGGLACQEGQHGERASGRIKADWLAARAAECPPAQPIVAKGSIVVRDLRLWHAGMPNRQPPDVAGRNSSVRVMLAMIHFAAWYRNPMRLQLADDVQPLLQQLDREGRLGLQVPVDWVSREQALATYLNRGFGNSYDFDQAP